MTDSDKVRPGSDESVLSRLLSSKLNFWVALLIALIADIASKAWADVNLRPLDPTGQTVVPVIPGVLGWKWAENRGAAFSILDGRADILAVIATVVLVAVFIYMFRADRTRRVFLVALGLVAAGAIGNLYDRLLLGHVRDFIFFDFDLPFHTWTFVPPMAGQRFLFFEIPQVAKPIPQRWPVFNVADMSILGGVSALVVLSLFSKDKKVEKPAKS